jgi:hypothetical protein
MTFVSHLIVSQEDDEQEQEVMGLAGAVESNTDEKVT